MASTRIAQVVVPEIYNPYFQTRTTQLSAIIQAGAMVMSPKMDQDLAGGGSSFNAPSWNDLARVAANIMTDNVYNNGGANDSVPQNIGSKTEIFARLSRHQSWGSVALAGALAGAEPMEAIGDLTGGYWSDELQSAFIAVWNGVFAHNATVTGGDTHVQNDLLFNASPSGVYSEGVTNFTARNYLNAKVTMGDAMKKLSMVAMHSVVYKGALDNNLIDFKSDSSNSDAEEIGTFLGAKIIVDDGMPNDPVTGLFDTWLFGPGSTGFGSSSFNTPSETERNPSAGNGAGEEILHNRVSWGLHPVGYAFTGTIGGGGPSNLGTSGNLAHEDSYARVYLERKQIRAARLITQEFPDTTP